MTKRFFKTAARAMVLSVAGCVLAGAGGCAADHSAAQLTLRSVQRSKTFTERFSNAYVTRDRDGVTDVVLTDQAEEQSLAGRPGDVPVRQVMHIRVLWNPTRDMHADHNAAANATIHWYVMGNTPASAADIIEYAGNAFITVGSDDDSADLVIRNASIKPVAARGELVDPVGPVRVQGSIRATADRQRVRQVLSGVRTVVAAANDLPNNVSYGDKPESPSSLVR